MLELYFEHTNPCTFCRLIIGKRIVAKGPGMPLSPKAIHKRVDEFDQRVAIKFGSKETNEFGE